MLSTLISSQRLPNLLFPSKSQPGFLISLFLIRGPVLQAASIERVEQCEVRGGAWPVIRLMMMMPPKCDL